MIIKEKEGKRNIATFSFLTERLLLISALGYLFQPRNKRKIKIRITNPTIVKFLFCEILIHIVICAATFLDFATVPIVV